jgi:tryptophan 2,3-dioxygenase
MLARVSKIMEQLVHAWDVLATMTPPEYSAIRPYLASSSGFPELPVPLHRVLAGQQERGHAQAP